MTKQNSQTIFTTGYPHYSSLSTPTVMAIIRRDHPNGGIECKWGMKQSRCSTNMSLYLGNDTI